MWNLYKFINAKVGAADKSPPTNAMKEKDFTETGVKIEGMYENDRNADSSQLFKDILKEVYKVTDVIIGHHLIYVKEDTREDGFTYQVVEEIPSADALIFDHDIMQKLFGGKYQVILAKLAVEPVETRDKLLGSLYYGRGA